MKSEEEMEQEMQQQQAAATAQSMADQMGQLASAPLMDPSKNPQIIPPPEDG